MSHFLHNEPCPRCLAKGLDYLRDNLTVWSDGHKYCFACGNFEQGDVVKRFSQHKEVVNSKGLLYPEIVPFSQECLDYLKIPCELNKFKPAQLTDIEIYEHLNGHPEGYSYFDDKWYLVRRLHKHPDGKVKIRGDVVGYEPLFVSPNTLIPDTVVLVEDILSAIKVSRVIDTIALLKTACHDRLLHRLANRYNNCYLWLDPDMYEHMANKLLPRIKPYFNKCKIIMSEHDPKVYSTNEIRRYIYENNE